MATDALTLLDGELEPTLPGVDAILGAFCPSRIPEENSSGDNPSDNLLDGRRLKTLAKELGAALPNCKIERNDGLSDAALGWIGEEGQKRVGKVEVTNQSKANEEVTPRQLGGLAGAVDVGDAVGGALRSVVEGWGVAQVAVALVGGSCVGEWECSAARHSQIRGERPESKKNLVLPVVRWDGVGQVLAVGNYSTSMSFPQPHFKTPKTGGERGADTRIESASLVAVTDTALVDGAAGVGLVGVEVSGVVGDVGEFPEEILGRSMDVIFDQHRAPRTIEVGFMEELYLRMTVVLGQRVLGGKTSKSQRPKILERGVKPELGRGVEKVFKRKTAPVPRDQNFVAGRADSGEDGVGSEDELDVVREERDEKDVDGDDFVVEGKGGEDGTVVGDQTLELVERCGVEVIGGDPTPNRHSKIGGACLQANRGPRTGLHALSVGLLEVPGGDDLGLAKIHPQTRDLAEEVDEGYDVVGEEGDVSEGDGQVVRKSKRLGEEGRGSGGGGWWGSGKR